MLWKDWMLLILGTVVAWTSIRDVVAGWRAQAFKKGPGQLWDVPRKEKPVRFWIAVVSHLVIAGLGVYLVVWKGAAIFTSLSVQ